MSKLPQFYQCLFAVQLKGNRKYISGLVMAVLNSFIVSSDCIGCEEQTAQAVQRRAAKRWSQKSLQKNSFPFLRNCRSGPCTRRRAAVIIKYGHFFVLFDYHQKPRAKAIFLQYTVYLAILPPPLLPFSTQRPLYRTLDSSSYPHSSLSFVIQGPSIGINTELTDDQLPVHLTYPTFIRTAATLLHMSLSAESLSL